MPISRDSSLSLLPRKPKPEARTGVTRFSSILFRSRTRGRVSPRENSNLSLAKPETAFLTAGSLPDAVTEVIRANFVPGSFFPSREVIDFGSSDKVRIRYYAWAI